MLASKGKGNTGMFTLPSLTSEKLTRGRFMTRLNHYHTEIVRLTEMNNLIIQTGAVLC